MQTSREATADEKLNYAIWKFLDTLEESLPDKKSRQVEYSIDVNVSLPGYSSPFVQNKILKILKDDGVVKELGEPDVDESSTVHDEHYSVSECHHLLLTNKFESAYKKYFNLVFKPSVVNEKQVQEPIPVTIVGEIGIKGFEEKVVLQKPKNKKIQLRKFPPDTKWEDIKIQFLNGQEVILKIKNLTYNTSYEEMGFQDERKKIPNKQWEFLKGLSEIGGVISWKSSRATPKGKKQKQLLAEALKAYFQINEDPFYPYKQESEYRIRITLIPESGQISQSENKDTEIEKFFKEESPEIYDK